MLKLLSLRSALIVVVVVTTVFAHQSGSEKKERENLLPGKAVLWADPGDVASLDFQYGVGGRERQPQPPFRFDAEDLSGSTAKINVTDGRGASWNVKWGHEVSPSTFCTRLVWACGYFAEPEYFVAQGRIEGVHGLTRAKSRVSKDGSFADARFQLRSDSPKFLKGYRWSWADNPFLGTRELQGLKILTLLVSNMDAKNVNLGIFEDNGSGERRYLYATADWGGSLGNWGNLVTRSIADCKGFASQTPDFVKGVENGRLRWNFTGKNRSELTDNISVSDVQWLLQYLGKVTDAQIRQGLSASGVTPEDTECYARALRERIERLQTAAGVVPAQNSTAWLLVPHVLGIVRDPRFTVTEHSFRP